MLGRGVRRATEDGFGRCQRAAVASVRYGMPKSTILSEAGQRLSPIPTSQPKATARCGPKCRQAMSKVRLILTALFIEGQVPPSGSPTWPPEPTRNCLRRERPHALQLDCLISPIRAAVVTRLRVMSAGVVAPRAELQPAAIASLSRALDQKAIDYWLFGGWAVEVWVGRVTQGHDDVDVEFTFVRTHSNGRVAIPLPDHHRVVGRAPRSPATRAARPQLPDDSNGTPQGRQVVGAGRVSRGGQGSLRRPGTQRSGAVTTRGR